MAAALSPQILARFNRYLSKHLGLFFPAARLCELEQKMALVARELGFPEVEPCLAWLMSAPLSGDQIDVLARHLTIGETYFLRDLDSYRVLEEELLPVLLRARRKGEKVLRIWSAGCSTGEEPYSIAILLQRLVPDLADWDVQIHATDINASALEKARLGLYGPWSFRNAPSWLFDHLAKRGDGRHEVPARIRRLVRFSTLNLVSDDYSSLFPEGSVDIVFCRNVMLYFEQEVRSDVVARLHRILAEGGWLFVSPTEVDHRIFTDFGCRRFSGALVFRKGHRAGDEAEGRLEVAAAPCDPPPERIHFAAAPREAPVAPTRPPLPRSERSSREDALSRGTELAAQGRYLEAVDAGHAALAHATNDPDALELLAQSYASLGRLDEARHYCEKAIAADRLRPENYYLLSIILQEQGLVQEAVSSLKRTLYLDQDFLLAHFVLGKLDRQAGREQESRRHFGNALRLLEKRESHEVLPQAAGLTAGRLAEIIRATLEGRMKHV